MVNGNGGQMIGRNSRTSAGKQTDKGGRKKSAKPSKAVNKLSKAVGKKVEENSEQIAQSLLDSTLQGHVLSARLLVSLAERPAEELEEAEQRRLISLAENLQDENNPNKHKELDLNKQNANSGQEERAAES